MSKTKNLATAFAILAAALYAMNIPFSKILLQQVEPAMMAAFLYLGAGIGLLVYSGVCHILGRKTIQEPLTKKELPYTAAMVVLDIAAPILLMYGIAGTNSANASLLNNFEIVATSLIALFVFREVLSKRLWMAIVLVTAASVILSFEGEGSFEFHSGSLLILGACVCWGFENNCTKMLSSKSSIEITTIKGCFSGIGSLIVAVLCGEHFPLPIFGAAAMVLGFVSYGLSINFYILAQKNLGAAKTSAYYSIAPFLGVVFGMLIFGERPGISFYAALLLMIVSTILMVKDTIALQHTHVHTHVHTHEHRHGDLVHTHEHVHEHSHTHVHGEDEENHRHNHEDLEEHHHSHLESDCIYYKK